MGKIIDAQANDAALKDLLETVHFADDEDFKQSEATTVAKKYRKGDE